MNFEKFPAEGCRFSDKLNSQTIVFLGFSWFLFVFVRREACHPAF